MNWSDMLVIGVVLVFGIIGLMNGLIFSIYRIASYFISVIISVKFYPVVAEFMMKTPLYTNIKALILKNLLVQQQAQTPGVNGQVKQAAADTVISSLHLPAFLKGTLISRIPDPSKLIDMTKIMDNISGQLAAIVIDVISLVLLYILIRVGLVFVKFILQGIAGLPLLKQVDKLGGFAFGAVEGLLTVYIVFAVLMLFHTSPQFKGFFDAVDNSSFAKFFYQNNFIIDWMFPKIK